MVAARDIAAANGITRKIVERYVPGWTPDSFPKGYSWRYNIGNAGMVSSLCMLSRTRARDRMQHRLKKRSKAIGGVHVPFDGHDPLAYGLWHFIAVELPVTQQPPHGSRHADFPHQALQKYSLPQKASCRSGCCAHPSITLGASDDAWFLDTKMF